MAHRLRFVLAALTCAVLLATEVPAAEGTHLPSLRLIGTQDSVKVVRRKKSKPARFDLGVWVASVGGAFELRAKRPDYTTPVDLQQVDASTVAQVRDLSDDLLQGWSGLRRFLEITVRDQTDALVHRSFQPFCLNSTGAERVGDAGPLDDHYPVSCRGGPFALGTVWGIDDGWAVSTFSDAVISNIRDGLYDVTISIAEPYVNALEIVPADASTTMTLEVRTRRRRRGRAASSAVATGSDEATLTVPLDDSPEPATLPDLAALPAWAIGVTNGDGASTLRFAATEWNSGPAPLVVEGFRESGTADHMDAFQYFYEDGQPVGRDEIGQLAYHAGGGHDHWHFEQFAVYQLLDENDVVVETSGKQAWCLVPTDPIDLTLEGANWRPGTTDLSSACGSPDSLWIREVLDVGHGDTYFQSLAGQSFDVRDVPSGNYRIRVEVNPDDVIHETNDSNNVADREIVIGGNPGERRTVEVLPWNGITS
jgi:hypothetical protein